MGVLQYHYKRFVPPSPLVRSKFLSLRSQVVLGSPSTGCNGVGICKMYMKAIAPPLRCPVIEAQLSISETGRLRIRFSKAVIETRYLKRHFRWNLFQVIDPFELPGWMQRKLELTQERIEPGVYTVLETPEVFIVDF